MQQHKLEIKEKLKRLLLQKMVEFIRHAFTGLILIEFGKMIKRGQYAATYAGAALNGSTENAHIAENV
jgi:hypothetical protein